VAVAIRMKRMGRTHREFYRICATDRRSPRDGRVIEELGTYDPHVSETDARCTLNAERVDYWLSVGAQPSDAVRVLIKKYGTNGTHLAAMEEARERLKMPKQLPDVGPPAFVPKEPEPEAPPAAEGEAAVAEGQTAEQPEAAAAEQPAGEAPAAEPVAETAAEEPAADAAPEPAAEEPAAEEPAAEEAKSE
jgi:small subunit ribosomal protein S16